MVPSVKYVFGAQSLAKSSPDVQRNFLAVLEKYDVHKIDTAWNYPGSEEALGALKAAETFIIDSKSPSLFPGALKRDSLYAGFNRTITSLKTASVDIYYLHTPPDDSTDLGEVLDAIHELYQQGKFRRFGISNHTPEQVQKVYDCAKARGTVLPMVFQGNYNAIARRYETDLFPLLRSLDMSFYAYSPLAGGFFVKSPLSLAQGTEGGRFRIGSLGGEMYNALYNKPSLINALKTWGEIAESAGVSKASLAYRWVAYHSFLDAGRGDAMVIGASQPEQLQDTLQGLADGPLDDWVVDRIEAIWTSVKDEAPTDNFSSFLQDRFKLK